MDIFREQELCIFLCQNCHFRVTLINSFAFLEPIHTISTTISHFLIRLYDFVIVTQESCKLIVPLVLVNQLLEVNSQPPAFICLAVLSSCLTFDLYDNILSSFYFYLIPFLLEHAGNLDLTVLIAICHSSLPVIYDVFLSGTGSLWWNHE